jgi:hypothetical protein
MPGGGHRFEFVGEIPFVFSLVFILLIVNTFLFFLLGFIAKHFLPKASFTLPPCEALAEAGIQYHAPEFVCWYADHSLAIQWILLALGAGILIVFRGRVRYIPPR